MLSFVIDAIAFGLFSQISILMVFSHFCLNFYLIYQAKKKWRTSKMLLKYIGCLVWFSKKLFFSLSLPFISFGIIYSICFMHLLLLNLENFWKVSFSCMCDVSNKQPPYRTIYDDMIPIKCIEFFGKKSNKTKLEQRLSYYNNTKYAVHF